MGVGPKKRGNYRSSVNSSSSVEDWGMVATMMVIALVVVISKENG